ncbi:MAG: HAD hydrolase family protein [Candidatus Cloacimonetes bacterium]|jgi:3-deoxy-D-manno-octulosonate 8-phosphate phosphatase (KDO 8-P phosphatase)|nr:HAD hydrolase family protein [Candidatus Cloacimonadota bacterium]
MAHTLSKPNKRPVPWDIIKLIVFDCDGVLTDGRIIYGDGRQDLKNFDATDGMGLMMLQHVDLPVAVVTGRTSEALALRCQDLKIEHLYQGISRKLECVSKLLDELGLEFENIVYMGDDWNDIPCMRRAAFSVAPAQAHEDIRVQADMVTKRHGGRGAVRELIDYVLHKKGLQDRAITSYLESVS